jgi:hypothetical protein
MFWDSGAVRFVDAGVAEDNRKEAEGVDYSEQRVRLSIVHTRQDVVLMCCHLGSISSSLWWIKICVILITLRYVVEPWLKQHGW